MANGWNSNPVFPIELRKYQPLDQYCLGGKEEKCWEGGTWARYSPEGWHSSFTAQQPQATLLPQCY